MKTQLLLHPLLGVSTQNVTVAIGTTPQTDGCWRSSGSQAPPRTPPPAARNSTALKPKRTCHDWPHIKMLSLTLGASTLHEARLCSLRMNLLIGGHGNATSSPAKARALQALRVLPFSSSKQTSRLRTQASTTPTFERASFDLPLPAEILNSENAGLVLKVSRARSHGHHIAAVLRADHAGRHRHTHEQTYAHMHTRADARTHARTHASTTTHRPSPM
eukprot:2528738-Pleurochrysis_carterae.AAC.1